MTIEFDDNRPADVTDVVVIGAGFAGLYLVKRLYEAGLGFRAFEAGADVGGTWYWNRYPGARCDVESVDYSYSFLPDIDQEWEWTERFAAQPEILRYINHVADRLDLRRHITFRTKVVSAHFDAPSARWTVTTDAGETVSSRYLVMATGCLSKPNWPRIDGLDSFAGQVIHTARWPDAPVDFRGKRVGIIGTGSSACQSLPHIARDAAHVTVFQRTANHILPANTHPLEPDYMRYVKQHYPELRQRWRTSPLGTNFPLPDRSALEVSARERDKAYEYRWGVGGLSFAATFNDLLFDLDANRTAADFVKAKIHALVEDQKTAALLTDFDHPLASKRLCSVDGYLESFNRPNVELVSVKERPIDRIEPEGVRIGDTLHRFDMLIVATGFDSMTGAILDVDIQGRDGLPIRTAWSNGPVTYLGLMIAGFPNLFTVTGPGSPSVVGNVIGNIEQHVDWITACIADADRQGSTTIEATPAAQDQWMEHVRTLGDMTIFKEARSWYTGHNIEGKPKGFAIFVGGGPAYAAALADVVAGGYRGFAFDGVERSAGTAGRPAVVPA